MEPEPGAETVSVSCGARVQVQVQVDRARLLEYSQQARAALEDAGALVIPTDLIADPRDFEDFVRADLARAPAGVMMAAHALHATRKWYEDASARFLLPLDVRSGRKEEETRTGPLFPGPLFPEPPPPPTLSAEAAGGEPSQLLRYALAALDEGMPVARELCMLGWRAACDARGEQAAGRSLDLMSQLRMRGGRHYDSPEGMDARRALIRVAYAAGAPRMGAALAQMCHPMVTESESVELVQRAIADGRPEEAAEAIAARGD